MSLQDINAAAAAQNNLTDAISNFMGTVDDDLAQRQAAYDALAANLLGIVGDQMNFIAFVDPDDPAPTNVRNGTFNTIRDAVHAAPYRALVDLRLAGDKSHIIDNDIQSNARRIIFRRNGGTNRPVIIPEPQLLNGNSNAIRGINMTYDAEVFVVGCDLQLANAKVDPAYGWDSTYSTFIKADGGAGIRFVMIQCAVTGAEDLGVVSALNGALIRLSTHSCSLDGQVTLLKNANSGTSIIAKSVLTLANGATLTDGGTVGTNLLHN